MQLGPDLIYKSSLVSPYFLQKNKKQDDFLFQNAFYDFFQITPDILAETVIGNLKS